ncbi:MAG: hypothetical protein EZS28_002018 [Streblomastix strix]|uniref:Uncharacterized protein n=1 Tax=Streblomastix strix TaxID=222440 RepID=A0A5J4X5J2_9EUKA|nr:MAG: hypothetical protein EZS28_002018 [Streblomastix strix]
MEADKPLFQMRDANARQIEQKRRESNMSKDTMNKLEKDALQNEVQASEIPIRMQKAYDELKKKLIEEKNNANQNWSKILPRVRSSSSLYSQDNSFYTLTSYSNYNLNIIPNQNQLDSQNAKDLFW